jgi:hypothetical protein
VPALRATLSLKKLKCPSRTPGAGAKSSSATTPARYTQARINGKKGLGECLTQHYFLTLDKYNDP